jgi:hypothetical protein
MALAIAVQMFPFALVHDEVHAPGAARWSGEWWMDKAKDTPNKPTPLGFYNRRSD